MSQILSLTLRHLKKVWLEQHIPNISEQNAECIKGLIREKNPKRMLEIGTANGYSALHFSSVLSEWASLTTLEKAWNMHSFAVENFKNCKIKNIHAIWWDAKEVIPTLKDIFFDCIYIDAMKREYLDYFLLVIPKMTDDALIIIDDVVKFWDKMSDFYEWLKSNNIPYQIEMTDADDGIMVLYKKDIPFYE